MLDDKDFIYVLFTFNRKRQDDVFVKWEHHNTLQKLQHYLRYETKTKQKYRLSYCETYVNSFVQTSII